MSKIKVLKNYFVRSVRLLATNGLFAFALLLSASTVSTADPLENWYLRNPLIQTNYFADITYASNIFVAVGGGGTILTSPDGVTWTTRTITSGTDRPRLNKIIYASNIFVAVGSGGMILTSPDGITWTSRTSGTAEDLENIVYGNNTFVAVGYGAILTSPDGTTWTPRTSGTTIDKITAIAYGNNTFVAVGTTGKNLSAGTTMIERSTGTIYTSPDGITWTPRYVEVGTSFVQASITYVN